MGFYNLLESFFFVSLAISFILIVMLVYHFKERLVNLEQKNDTMFHILNNLIKELKHMQENPSVTDDVSPTFSNVQSTAFPISMFSLFNNPNTLYHDENPVEKFEIFKSDKIVVSDSEDDVKVITIDINNDNENIEDSDNESTVGESSDDDDDEDGEDVDVAAVVDKPVITETPLDNIVDEETHEIIELSDLEIQEEKDTNGTALDKSIDYKRLDVNYLRELVVSRGLTTDSKKMKKNELIKLLSDE
jgi:hypothetical protein